MVSLRQEKLFYWLIKLAVNSRVMIGVARGNLPGHSDVIVLPWRKTEKEIAP
jgi:hypothetical protein